MVQKLAMRGPDGEGFWYSPHAVLAHRRLIVIDPVGGSQPMRKRIGERELIITYNGELYNMPELRQKLQLLGYH